jgi:hypothetical protein
MIGIIFELSTLNKSPIGRVWSRDMSNTDIVVKLLFIRLNVGDWIDFELDDTHKVTSIRKIDDYLPTISTPTLKVVTFESTDIFEVVSITYIAGAHKCVVYGN